MRAELIMMVGVSYSGKSTYAQSVAEMIDATIFSSDAIRKELYGDEGEQKNPGKVFDILHRRIIKHLREGGRAIYDATNLSCKRRMNFLKMLENSHIDCEKRVFVILCTPSVIKQRMEQRERKVPWEVVHRQICQFQMPYYYEGWDDIKVIKTCDVETRFKDVHDAIEAVVDFKQDNPNHKWNLGGHLSKAFDCALCHNYNKDVQRAALYHDIGKIFTKTFVNHKGETTNVAHYYGHEGWSAYYLMLAAPDVRYVLNNWIRSAVLVQWHMAHYMRTPESMETLYKMLAKSRLDEELKQLERCDKEAH